MNALRPISQEDFERDFRKGDLYYFGRWGYFREAMRMVMRFRPATLLELGSAVPIITGADTMDLYKQGATFRYDARVCPWPVADKQYDAFLGLQVWEHLRNDDGTEHQARAFDEVQRIADCAVLSFPYNWTDCGPDDEHYMIDDDRIAAWTRHVKPVETKTVERPRIDNSPAAHILLAFDFRL